MSVNPVTGIVTYTLAEWKEESQLWERDGALRERERIIKLLIEEGILKPRTNENENDQQIIELIKGNI